jgi:hypothetical protein
MKGKLALKQDSAIQELKALGFRVPRSRLRKPRP